MTKQLDILGGETTPPRQRPLGKRQQYALQLILETGGLTDTEMGALIHYWRGRHGPKTECEYCQQEGRSVLVSLRKHGLVTRRKTGVWTLPGKQPRTGPQPTQDIPY